MQENKAIPPVITLLHFMKQKNSFSIFHLSHNIWYNDNGNNCLQQNNNCCHDQFYWNAAIQNATTQKEMMIEDNREKTSNDQISTLNIAAIECYYTKAFSLIHTACTIIIKL